MLGDSLIRAAEFSKNNNHHLRAKLAIILDNILHNRQPVPDGIEFHLHAAMEWILHAQAVNSDGGISASYGLLSGKWSLSYPETTGYSIPTLFLYAKQYERKDVYEAALRMVEYELDVQLANGGFPKLKEKINESDHPVAFDTGQVIFGFLSAFSQTHDTRYLNSAVRAGDWLISQQTKDGYWWNYQHQNISGTIDTLVSWALLVLFNLTGMNKYKESAGLQVDWALRQQRPNGWFSNCSFHADKPPILHTIAYTVEGLLESGIILNNEDCISAAVKVADILMNKVLPSGYIPGAFHEDWHPAVSWSCLTGNAQMARIWSRLAKVTGNSRYNQIAEIVLNFIASTQYLDRMPKDIRGGIAGSWPIYGEYLRLKYPNWAANHFASAVLNLKTNIANI
jgi:hypothetical protein